MSDPDGALDSVKEAFQGKRGKVLIVGGGIAIAVYVYWTRVHGSTPAATDTTGTDTGTSSAGAGAGATTSPQSDPTVGNTTTGTGRRTYANNGEWLSDATDFLAGRGVPSGSAYSALSKALGGLQVTAQEASWVSQAIGALGAPPEGMPPLNSTAPPGTGSTQGKLTAPTGLKVTNTSSTAVTLTWTGVSGAKGYQVATNGGHPQQAYYPGLTVTHLKPNTQYSIAVRAASGSAVGPAATVTARTKK